MLDLSTNLLRGRVPPALGDISPNLDTMQLQLNRLSCDLPKSVLGWQTSSANVSITLLDGNLFGCGPSTFGGFSALSIQSAAGLRKANEQAFDAYSCGNSDYAFPVITIIILAVPVIIGLVVRLCQSRLALQWRVALTWLVNPTTLINELDHADRQIRSLAVGIMAGAAIAGSVALLLSLRVAKSAFECEYMAAPTLANKRASAARSLSVGIGTAVCLGLVLGHISWWHRLVSKCGSGTNIHGGTFVDNKLLRQSEEDAEDWDFDAERMAESALPKSAKSRVEVIIWAIKIVALLLALVILTVGPNIGYVSVVLSNFTQQQKVASEVAVTLVKTAIGTLLVPRVARKAVNLLVLHDALTFVRFRLRVLWPLCFQR